MTRVNVGYPVEKLTRQHLIAEHREIKRIPNMVASGKAKLDNIPDTFRLGKGHVVFFYNKLGYLLIRYKKLYNECIRRGYNVQDYSSAWENVPTECMGWYVPTDEARKLIVERIQERLS